MAGPTKPSSARTLCHVCVYQGQALLHGLLLLSPLTAQAVGSFHKKQNKTNKQTKSQHTYFEAVWGDLYKINKSNCCFSFNSTPEGLDRAYLTAAGWK